MLSEALFYKYAAYSSLVMFFRRILFMTFQSTFEMVLVQGKILTWHLSHLT